MVDVPENQTIKQNKPSEIAQNNLCSLVRRQIIIRAAVFSNDPTAEGLVVNETAFIV